MADHSHRICARLAILLRTERASRSHPDPADVKEIAGHKLALDRLPHTVAVPTHEGGFRIERSQRGKGLIVVAEVGVAWITQALIAFKGRPAVQTLPPHLPQFAWLMNRRGTKQQRIDEGEDRGVGGNAQTQ